MAINLFEARYIPTIFLRNSELKAVKELPDSTKDNLTPIFCLKPWSVTPHLGQAVQKIAATFGEDRMFFIDIDPFYKVEEVKRVAQQEFLELIEHEDKAQNWIDFLKDHPNACPCIQVNNASVDDVIKQIEAFTYMDRPFLVRLQHGGGAGHNWSAVVDAVCQTDHANFGFVVDMEWSLDQISRIAWADPIIKRIVALRGDSIPICVNGSSFPNSFTGFDSGDGVSIQERLAFKNLVATNNQARLIYGDWASSRPPGEPIPMKNEIPPRIDLPTGQGWEFYRIRKDEGGFKEAARLAMQSSSYPHDLDIWATYTIASTAQAEAGDEINDAIIKSGSRAAAARINLHLYRQQFFDDYDPAPDTDDDFVE